MSFARVKIMRSAAIAFLGLNLIIVAPRASAQPNPELATFQTLISRFASICLNAWPDQKSFQTQIAILQLWPTDMTRYAAIVGKSDVQGYSGDLGGSGPRSEREMIVTTGSSPIKGCAVSTRIVPLDDVTDGFVDAVREYVAHRRQGRLEDASSRVPEVALRVFGHVRRLDYVVGKKITEQFTATEAPAAGGLVNYQLPRRQLVATPK
jgi:hypothetical protein